MNTAAEQAGAGNNSSSLRRALSVLFQLADDSTPPANASLGEFAEALSLNKSTLLRLLVPLREAQLVEQTASLAGTGSAPTQSNSARPISTGSTCAMLPTSP